VNVKGGGKIRCAKNFGTAREKKDRGEGVKRKPVGERGAQKKKGRLEQGGRGKGLPGKLQEGGGERECFCNGGKFK